MSFASLIFVIGLAFCFLLSPVGNYFPNEVLFKIKF